MEENICGKYLTKELYLLYSGTIKNFYKSLKNKTNSKWKQAKDLKSDFMKDMSDKKAHAKILNIISHLGNAD